MVNYHSTNWIAAHTALGDPLVNYLTLVDRSPENSNFHITRQKHLTKDKDAVQENLEKTRLKYLEKRRQRLITEMEDCSFRKRKLINFCKQPDIDECKLDAVEFMFNDGDYYTYEELLHIINLNTPLFKFIIILLKLSFIPIIFSFAIACACLSLIPIFLPFCSLLLFILTVTFYCMLRDVPDISNIKQYLEYFIDEGICLEDSDEAYDVRYVNRHSVHSWSKDKYDRIYKDGVCG